MLLSRNGESRMGNLGERVVELGGGSKDDVEGWKEGVGSLFEEG